MQAALALIRDLRAAGVTVLMVEHAVGAIFDLSHRVAVLNAGELIALGAPAAISRDPRVIDAYLGAAHAA